MRPKAAPRRPVFQTRAAQDRGAIIPLVALVLPVIVLMTAFAVDLGRQRDARRTAQARADVLSLDLVRSIDDRGACELLDAPDIQIELQSSAHRNDVDISRVAGLVWGHLEPDPDGLMEFVPHHRVGEYPDEGCDYWPVPTSVRILTHDEVEYAFQPGTGEVNRDAVANVVDEQLAEFMLGSTLVNVTPASNRVIGRMLSRVIPGADLVGYGGLANATVTLRDLAIALGLGSTDELLDADVTFEELVIASANALDASGGDAAGVAVLNELASLGIQDAHVNMGEVLGLSTTASDAGLDGWVSIPQMLVAAVTLIDGNHTITIPGTELNVAGLASVTLDLRGIEPPIRVADRDGAEGTTRQIELGVSVDLGVSGDRQQRVCELPSDERSRLASIIGGLFQVLNCTLAPLTTALLEVSVDGTIDLELDLGTVWGQQSISCPDERLLVAYQSTPGLAVISTDYAVSVVLDGQDVTLLGGQASGSAPIEGAAGTLTFGATDDGPRHTEFEWIDNPGYYETHGTARIGSPTLGLANLLQLGNVRLTLLNENLPTLGGIARNLVQPMINDILSEVDDFVVFEVSRLLGLNLGGADITPQWIHCDQGLRLVG